MCGDYRKRGKGDLKYLGSPPHVRGLHHVNVAGVEGYRITPACAGTTCWTTSLLQPTEDHPRMCGDY